MLAPLRFIRSLLFNTDVSYFKFLNRVHDVELSLRAQQLWDVPHPWLDMFIPASSMTTFDSLVFQQLVPVEYGGPIFVYPVNRNKWDRRTTIVVPDEEVFYLVAFLRNELPSGPSLESMLDENVKILRVCEDLNGKHYLPKYTEEEQWKQHFGCEKWTAFVQHKHMFDPHAILAPRQNMFRRNQNPLGLDQLLLLRSDSASS
ncbi:unnamed protein product [Sphagnum troendelagicum]|uniref:Cytokinin dehydrogenase 1 FAD/cytokinin binding domain-containing protein n=1 Tax=Sphagnum troendelagicum TaxID=128251 RepID=A0ABP0U3N6_9BRYO